MANCTQTTGELLASSVSSYGLGRLDRSQLKVLGAGRGSRAAFGYGWDDVSGVGWGDVRRGVKCRSSHNGFVLKPVFVNHKLSLVGRKALKKLMGFGRYKKLQNWATLFF